MSKAFDCLPYSLIIPKLRAYGLGIKATELIANYITNRSQRVKIGTVVSDWAKIVKGVPQGSIIGSLLFNIFMNDIVCIIKEGTLFNYADDNTIMAVSKTLNTTTLKLQAECKNIMKWVKINEMHANPEKFQVIFSEISNIPFKIDNDTTLNSEANVKLLGCIIDNKLNFNEHISKLCSKASRQINVLNRLGRLLDEDVKLMLYKCFITCHFNYCPIVWHSCGAGNTQKLEKIQYRALKFVYNDRHSSYEHLLSKANMPTLELSRLRNIALEVFKLQNKLSPPYICDLFTGNQRTHQYNLRHNSLSHSHFKITRYGLHSFNHLGVQIWNNLPNHFRTCTDFKIFKGLIKTWIGYSCKCSFCNYRSNK